MTVLISSVVVLWAMCMVVVVVFSINLQSPPNIRFGAMYFTLSAFSIKICILSRCVVLFHAHHKHQMFTVQAMFMLLSVSK